MEEISVFEYSFSRKRKNIDIVHYIHCKLMEEISVFKYSLIITSLCAGTFIFKITHSVDLGILGKHMVPVIQYKNVIFLVGEFITGQRWAYKDSRLWSL